MRAMSSACVRKPAGAPWPGWFDSVMVGSASTSWPLACRAGTAAVLPTGPQTTWLEMLSTLHQITFFSNSGLLLRMRSIAEAREVDGAVAAIDDEFGNGVARGRALLQPVAGEAVGEEEVRHLRVRADDGVLVERIVVVVARPRR